MRHTASVRRNPDTDRVLATVMFTDIVGSTVLAASVGDRRWQDLLHRHHALVRAALKRHRGREIDNAGDGFFAIFDRPAQAITCATEIARSVRSLGLQVRAGLHTGEVELRGKTASGIAVHVGARVLGEAGPDEILVTATLKDLVAGSSIEFRDRGTASLKGVPGEWRLYAVVAPAEGTESAPVEAAAAEGVRAGRDRRMAALIVVVGLVAVVAVGAFLVLPELTRQPVVPTTDTIARLPAGAAAFDLAVDVGQRPTGLAFGEGAVFVINFADQTLSRVDVQSGRVDANPAVGGTPTGIATGAGAVWVSAGFGLAREDGGVVRFNARTLQRETPVQIGNGAGALAFGEGALWVADRLRNLVVKIDPTTNAVAAEVPLGNAPDAVVVGAGSVWVSSSLAGVLWKIDPVGLGVVPISLATSPTALAVGDDTVWVSSEQTDMLTGISSATNSTTKTIPVGDGPRGLVASDGFVWVALGGAGEVVRVDPAREEVAQSLTLDGSPESVVVADDGSLWVSVHSP